MYNKELNQFFEDGGEQYFQAVKDSYWSIILVITLITHLYIGYISFHEPFLVNVLIGRPIEQAY